MTKPTESDHPDSSSSSASLSTAGEIQPGLEALLEQGVSQLDAGDANEALLTLRRAHALDPENARAQSWLGLATARAGGSFEQARSLCEKATKSDFDNPDLYVNLARVYLSVGRRPEALRYLRRGGMVDPTHTGIATLLREMGSRRPPVLSFIPRRHPVNRALGALRSLFADLLPSHPKAAAAPGEPDC